jgi:3-(3-hydroxy-phenyl)propionate hydroxylase
MAESRVIVVGAGPVGLVAAACLAEDGIPVTIVEAEADLPGGLRASTFHSPTLDMLDRFGVSAGLIKQGLICPSWQFRDREQGAIATFDFSVLSGDTAHPYWLHCEQWRVTRMLRDRLAANPDVTFHYGLRAAYVRQDADSVTLTALDVDDVTHLVRGRYLIGADGARSAVRKSLRIGFEGPTIPELYLTLSTPFRYDQAIPDLACMAYVSDPGGWSVLLRTTSLWHLLLPADPREREELMLSDGPIQQRMQAVLPGATPYEIRHRAACRVHERVAERYLAGRVFLAGDAAHVNSPLGDVGMNGGIHDAFNLAARLTEVWRGADLATMGRYERQRRQVALDVVQEQASRNRQILGQRDPALRRAHHDELRSIAADPELHRAFLLRCSMIQSLRDLEKVT